MVYFIFILIFVGIGVYLYRRRKKVVQELEKKQRQDEPDLIKGFRFHVTPKITTRQQVLKLRNRMFKTEKEAEYLDFRMDEATVVLETKSWDELGIKIIGEELNNQSGESLNRETWTDIGMMYPKELESYYSFLEVFRSIIEKEKMSPPERVERVQKMNDKNGFLNRLHEKYGKGFPKNIFIDQFAEINGISVSIGKQLYDMEIYDIEGLSRLDESKLKDLKGVGDIRAAKIKKAINNRYE